MAHDSNLLSAKEPHVTVDVLDAPTPGLTAAEYVQSVSDVTLEENNAPPIPDKNESDNTPSSPPPTGRNPYEFIRAQRMPQVCLVSLSPYFILCQSRSPFH
jgi:hypothetical protein